MLMTSVDHTVYTAILVYHVQVVHVLVPIHGHHLQQCGRAAATIPMCFHATIPTGDSRYNVPPYKEFHAIANGWTETDLRVMTKCQGTHACVAAVR